MPRPLTTCIETFSSRYIAHQLQAGNLFEQLAVDEKLYLSIPIRGLSGMRVKLNLDPDVVPPVLLEKGVIHFVMSPGTGHLPILIVYID